MRSRFVRVSRLVPLLAALVLLAGCLKLDADLTIGSDDTVTGTYVVAYKKNPDVQQPGLQTARPLLVRSGSADARPYDDGQYLGTRYELRGVPFADLAAFTAVSVQGRQTGTIQLVRDGDDVLVAGTFDFRETSSVKRTPQQEADARRLFTVRVTLTFPGDVQTSNGTTDGRSVTWDMPPFQRTLLEARAGAVAPAAEQVSFGRPANAARYTLWGGIGLAVIALLLGLLLLVRRMRRPEPEPVAPEATDFDWVLGERRPAPAGRREESRPADSGQWDRRVAGGAPAGPPSFRQAPGYSTVPGHTGQHPEVQQGAWPGTDPEFWMRPAPDGTPFRAPFRDAPPQNSPPAPQSGPPVPQNGPLPRRTPRQERPDDPAGRR